MPAFTAQYRALPAIARRPSPDEMFSTRRSARQAPVARRNAAVSSTVDSSPTRSAADSSAEVHPSAGPTVGMTPALLTSTASSKWFASNRLSHCSTSSATATLLARSRGHSSSCTCAAAARCASVGWRPRDRHSITVPGASSCSAKAAPRPREAPVRMTSRWDMDALRVAGDSGFWRGDSAVDAVGSERHRARQDQRFSGGWMPQLQRAGVQHQAAG